jgi:non-ribosomal peptide synthetase component E (peptide arylation enzyme)
MLLWTRLKSCAAAYPDKLAVICGDTRLTYAQFVDQAEHLAHAWLRQGLRPGDRIALHLRVQYFSAGSGRDPLQAPCGR